MYAVRANAAALVLTVALFPQKVIYRLDEW